MDLIPIGVEISGWNNFCKLAEVNIVKQKKVSLF